jgi:hypothetical protein
MLTSELGDEDLQIVQPHQEHKKRPAWDSSPQLLEKNQSSICPSLTRLYSERTGTVVPQRDYGTAPVRTLSISAIVAVRL